MKIPENAADNAKYIVEIVKCPILDVETVWHLKPEWIPGRVKSRVTKTQNGRVTNTQNGFITADLELHYPNGQKFDEVYCMELFNRFDINDMVMFTLCPSIPNERINRGQPDLMQVDYIEKITLEAFNAAIASFDIEVEKYQKFTDDQIEVARVLDDLLDLQSNMQHVIDKETEEKVEILTQELRKQKEYLELLDVELREKKVQLDRDTQEFDRVGGSDLVKLLNQMRGEYGQNIPVEAIEDVEFPSTIVADICSRFQEQDYYVDKEIIAHAIISICIAVEMGQFIILTGPPGSGKTSLVKKLAALLGAGSGVVPVRPAWIDTSDLIGYYDPRIERFQSTPFLDRVIDAKRYLDANRLYLLTLDEMNLARVENYAADFLSQYEKAREGDQDAYIDLYSQDICRRVIGKSNLDNQELANLLEHQTRFPPRMPIPGNLVFFGTMNIDETTILPSPKLLDRALIIQIADVNFSPPSIQRHINKLPANSAALEEKAQQWFLTPNEVRRMAKRDPEVASTASATWNDLMVWNEKYLKPLSVRLSHRLKKTFHSYINIAGTILDDKKEYQLDFEGMFMLAKILPLISFRDDELAEGQSSDRKIDILKRWHDKGQNIADYPLLQSALERMINRGGFIVKYLE